MALQQLRASTLDKRPQPASLADGQLAINTNATSPGLFTKDSSGALVKFGPIFIGTTAPNATPATGGSSGNAIGEQWLDTTGGDYILKTWDGTAWRVPTVTSSAIKDGAIVNADINAGAAIDYSKLAALSSGNIVLGNSSNVATSTAVTGDVTISNAGVTAISSGVIVNADINASAAIDYSKLATLTAGNIVLGNSSNVATSTAVTGDITISNAGVTAIASGAIVDADINANAEIAVSKLADGAARQLLQTDAAGTGVEWTDNIDVPGTLDVTGAAVFDGTITAKDNVTLNAQSDLRFADSDSSNWVALQAPATVASNVTWTLPSADGTTGQVLSTNGTGVLSWASASGSGGMTLIDTLTPANGTSSISKTGLTSYKSLIFIANAVGTSSNVTYALSANNGSSYTNGPTFTYNFSALDARGFAVLYGTDSTSATAKNGLAIDSFFTPIYTGVNITGVINAVRFAPSSGTFTGSGNILVYGVN